MQVKPGSSASLKSAFFLFCCFDMVQNFTQAGKKYSADIAKRGYTAGATRRPKENRNLQFKQSISESLRHFDALHY